MSDSINPYAPPSGDWDSSDDSTSEDSALTETIEELFFEGTQTQQDIARAVDRSGCFWLVFLGIAVTLLFPLVVSVASANNPVVIAVLLITGLAVMGLLVSAFVDCNGRLHTRRMLRNSEFLVAPVRGAIRPDRCMLRFPDITLRFPIPASDGHVAPWGWKSKTLGYPILLTTQLFDATEYRQIQVLHQRPTAPRFSGQIRPPKNATVTAYEIPDASVQVWERQRPSLVRFLFDAFGLMSLLTFALLVLLLLNRLLTPVRFDVFALPNEFASTVIVIAGIVSVFFISNWFSAWRLRKIPPGRGDHEAMLAAFSPTHFYYALHQQAIRCDWKYIIAATTSVHCIWVQLSSRRWLAIPRSAFDDQASFDAAVEIVRSESGRR